GQLMRAMLLVMLAAGTAAAADPPPEDASGVETGDSTPASERALVVPRAVMFLPRMAVWALGQPLRGAAYVYERYDLPGRFRNTFFNVGGTFGLYPIIKYQSPFGVTAGARLLHRDLFGNNESLKLRADFGGEFRQAYAASFRTGQLFGPVALELGTTYERRPR